jgi:hypothetical protein
MPKRTVVEGIAVIAFSMPIWAIPISFVADRLRSPDDDQTSKQIDILERWDRVHLPKPSFDPKSVSYLVGKRIFRVSTYLALNWVQAICGYFYVTTSVAVTLILYLVFLELAGFSVLVALTIPVISWIAAFLGLSVVWPCISAIFSGVDSVFVQPYDQLLSNAVLHLWVPEILSHWFRILSRSGFGSKVSSSLR